MTSALIIPGVWEKTSFKTCHVTDHGKLWTTTCNAKSSVWHNLDVISNLKSESSLKSSLLHQVPDCYIDQVPYFPDCYIEWMWPATVQSSWHTSRLACWHYTIIHTQSLCPWHAQRPLGLTQLPYLDKQKQSRRLLQRLQMQTINLCTDLNVVMMHGTQMQQRPESRLQRWLAETLGWSYSMTWSATNHL